MQARTFPDAARRIFWQVRAFDFHQRVEPDGTWWLENRRREPRGLVIFQYAAQGRMLYRDRHGEREVREGWAALFEMGEESAYGLPKAYGAPFHTQWISLEGAGLPEHVRFIRARYGSVFFVGKDSPLRDAMRSLCGRARTPSPAEAALASAAVYDFLMRLYVHLEEQWVRVKPPVERAVDDLLRHPTQALSLKEVAQRHGCSREHLTRVFRARTSASPARYLGRARLLRALELLRETRLPVRQVVEQSGFASSFTLARHVKAETGLAPGAFRERTRRR